MTVKFYKSLDRTFEFFGLKGKWITISLSAIGVSILIGVVVGQTVGSAIGTFTSIALSVVSFVGCLFIQSEISSRDLDKLTTESQMKFTVVRRETLSRILLQDSRFEEARRTDEDGKYLYTPVKDILKSYGYDGKTAK